MLSAGGFTCALANIYGDGGIIKEINEYTPSVVDPGRFMSALASLNEERTQESIDNWKSRFFFVQLSRSSADTPLYEYYPRQPKLFSPRLTEHDIGNANVHVFMNGKIIFSDKFEDVETTDATLQNLQGWEPRSIDQKNKLRCLSFTEKEGHLASLTGDDMFAEGLVRVEIFVTPVRWEAWSSFSEPTWSPFNPGHFAHFRWNFLKDDLLIKFGMKPQYAFFSETVIPDHIASLCKATRELSIRDPRL